MDHPDPRDRLRPPASVRPQEDPVGEVERTAEATQHPGTPARRRAPPPLRRPLPPQLDRKVAHHMHRHAALRRRRPRQPGVARQTPKRTIPRIAVAALARAAPLRARLPPRQTRHPQRRQARQRLPHLRRRRATRRLRPRARQRRQREGRQPGILRGGHAALHVARDFKRRQIRIRRRRLEPRVRRVRAHHPAPALHRVQHGRPEAQDTHVAARGV